jgi:tRNA A37 threonylcarbamoyladenosine synthetase subunit TsaC/SUA5/YrdC
MRIIPLQEFLDNEVFYIQEVQAGKIFVYPTDTVYGIWGIYQPHVIDKIFSIKKRDERKLFSIIAPSFDRIEKNHGWVNIETLKQYLHTYHGVTYIFDYAKPGVRIIKHPFQTFVEMLGEPFITTSCNIAGEPVITDIKNLPQEIADNVDYIIDGWELWGKPSVLIDLVENKIIER